jgi:hypothetical protein
LLFIVLVQGLELVSLFPCFCAFSFYFSLAKARFILLRVAQEQHRVGFSRWVQAQFRPRESLYFVSESELTPVRSRLSRSFEICYAPDSNCTALNPATYIFVSKRRVLPRWHTYLSELCLRVVQCAPLNNVFPLREICEKGSAAVDQRRGSCREAVVQGNHNLLRQR